MWLLIVCQVREADENDPHREKAVQLLDDFKISGVNGTRILVLLHLLIPTEMILSLFQIFCVTV